MTRYFTFRLGKFQDGCRAIAFEDNGHSFFIREDGTVHDVRQVLFRLADAERAVETNAWIEVTEEYAYGRTFTPRTDMSEAW